MSGRAFLDTSVLIYAFAAGDPRTARAERLLAAGGVISVQVLNELVNVSRRKLGRGWDEIEDLLSVGGRGPRPSARVPVLRRPDRRRGLPGPLAGRSGPGTSRTAG